MSSFTIRYDDIALHTEREQLKSKEFQDYLDLNNIDYKLLEYESNFTQECIDALNTWSFKNKEGPRGNFTAMPILTYHDILYDNGKDVFSKVFYAISIDQLLEDFILKAVKRKL